MAEYVEKSLEEMLPELEQMERVGLFTKQETRSIMKKRTALEYKLKRRTKSKDDFLKYIQYETDLLALVKKRRQRTGYQHKKQEIDVAILQRIHRLFRFSLFRFPDDVKLWLSHIAFCKKRHEKVLVGRLYSKMLQVHNKKPDLWVSAAKWEFEDNANPDGARALLQRAIRFIPTSKHLWLEYYRMELLFAEKMRKRQGVLGVDVENQQRMEDNVIKGQVAHVVFQQAIQAIPEDVDFLLSFIPICQLFDFTQEGEKEIFKYLQEHHSNKAVMWDALARRNLGRKHGQSSEDEDPEVTFHRVYGEAISTVPTDEMWALYIKACLELLQNAKKKGHAQRLQRVLLVFEEARETDHMTVELWDKWVQLLTDTGSLEMAIEVCNSATTAHPGVASLWRQRLALQTAVGGEVSELHNLLTQAQKHVKKDVWPLTQVVLDHSIAANAADNTVKLLESSMIGSPDVSIPAKEFYLEYEYLNHGIQHARKIFDRMSKYRPLSLQFYRSYITMELAQSKPKMDLVRRAYEDAVQDHGDKDPELWLDYINTEIKHPKGKAENVGKLHYRAVKILQGEANQQFINKYTLAH